MTQDLMESDEEKEKLLSSAKELKEVLDGLDL